MRKLEKKIYKRECVLNEKKRPSDTRWEKKYSNNKEKKK